MVASPASRTAGARTIVAQLPGDGSGSRGDVRRWQRRVAALVLPLGPAAVAVLRFVLPYKTTDDPGAVVPKVLADVETQSLVLWLAFVASLTLVPAVFAVGRLTRRRTPRLTAAALVLAVPGYLALTWMIGADLLLWTGAQAGVDATTLTQLFATTHATSAIAAGLFVLGHVVGTVLLGVALWRSRAVPRWAALATIVSQPLHFVAAVVLGSPSLDLVAWGLNAAGFTAAAVAVLWTRDEEWDLPPATRAVEPQGSGEVGGRMRGIDSHVSESMNEGNALYGKDVNAMESRRRTSSGSGDLPEVKGVTSAPTGMEPGMARLGVYGGAELVANLFGGAQKAQHEAQRRGIGLVEAPSREAVASFCPEAQRPVAEHIVVELPGFVG